MTDAAADQRQDRTRRESTSEDTNMSKQPALNSPPVTREPTLLTPRRGIETETHLLNIVIATAHLAESSSDAKWLSGFGRALQKYTQASVRRRRTQQPEPPNAKNAVETAWHNLTPDIQQRLLACGGADALTAVVGPAHAPEPAAKPVSREPMWSDEAAMKPAARGAWLPPAEYAEPNDLALAEHAAVIRALGKRVVGDVIEIGRRLVECKDRVGHGGWLPWLDREFAWSDETARKYMRVYELAGKSQSSWDFDLPVSSLYLLAAPSTPEEARTEVMERAEAGEALTQAQIKEIVDDAVIASRADVEAQLRRARDDADRRVAEVRAEYDGKLLIEDPAELQAEINKIVAPLHKQIDDLESKLAKIRKKEQERIDQDRKERSKQAKGGTTVGIDSQMSLNETLVRHELRNLVGAILKITPDQAIGIAMQSAAATEQTLSQWLGQSPNDASAAIGWLRKFIELAGG